tara:strand:+ start:3671 stop:4894 length:1224 start_codon:yes stop_codon:yes gene_type:complete
MKILFISSNSSPRGGGEDFMIYLCRAYSKFNKNLFGIYSNKNYMNKFVDKIERYTKEVVKIKYKELSQRNLRFLSSIFDINQIFKIYKAINKIKPNLIIINQQYDEDALEIIISSTFYKLINNSSVKISSVIHMPRIENKINKQPFGFARYIVLLIIYGILDPILLLTTKECLEEFRKYYFFNKKKSFLVKSPLPEIKKRIGKKYSLEIINKSNIPKFAKVKLNNWLKNKRQIILLGCQMKTQKNPLFALSCWMKLRKMHKSSACFLIIGDGPLKNIIDQQISNLELNERKDILQINWVPELSQYILISDLLLMPSSFEGMNLTLLECISYNKDVILSKFEGITELQKYARNCHQIIKFDEKIWAKKIHEKLSFQNKNKRKNSLNKKFISYYSDYECFNSFKKSINF